MAIDDVIGSVGVKVVPIVDERDIAQAVERAAQRASGASTASVRAAAAATSAAAATGIAMQRPGIGGTGGAVELSAIGPVEKSRPGGFDPRSLVEQIQQLETLAAQTKGKDSRSMLQAAAAGYRAQIASAGFTYEQLTSPEYIASQRPDSRLASERRGDGPLMLPAPTDPAPRTPRSQPSAYSPATDFEAFRQGSASAQWAAGREGFEDFATRNLREAIDAQRRMRARGYSIGDAGPYIAADGTVADVSRPRALPAPEGATIFRRGDIVHVSERAMGERFTPGYGYRVNGQRPRPRTARASSAEEFEGEVVPPGANQTNADWNRAPFTDAYRWSQEYQSRQRSAAAKFVRAARAGPRANAEGFADWLSGTRATRGSRRGPQGTMIGNAFGWMGSKAIRGMRPANQFRAIAMGRRIRGLGNRQVMTTGMFMNTLFGGMEIFNTMRGTMGAAAQAEGMAPSAESANLLLQGYQSSAGGFLGSFANAFIDPFGVRAAGVANTIAGAEAQDAAGLSRRAMAATNRANRTLGPVSRAGQSIAVVSGQMAANAEAANAFLQEQRLADSATAADTYSREKDFWSWQSVDRNFDLRNRLDTRQRENQRTRLGQQTAANAEAANVLVTDYVRTEMTAAADYTRAARFAGDPVIMARASMTARHSTEIRELTSDGTRSAFMAQEEKSGVSTEQAARNFDRMQAATFSRVKAEGESFESGVAFNLDETRRAYAAAARVSEVSRSSSSWGRAAAWEEQEKEREIAFTRAGGDPKTDKDYLAARFRRQEDFFYSQDVIQDQEERAGRDYRDSRRRADTTLGIQLRGQRNVMQASIDANSGRASRMAPRVAGRIAAFMDEANDLRNAGFGHRVNDLRTNATMALEADQADFFNAFAPMQRASLDEIDTSGREVARIGEEFREGRKQIAAPSPVGSSGGAVRAGITSAADAVRSTVRDITATFQETYYRKSVQAMESP